MYHLSHFHFLSFLKNTAINICVQLFVRVYVFISLGHIARSGLLDRVVILCVWFWENVRLFSSQSVQSLSHVWLFATPWTAACQASLSITNSWSLLKLMSIELVIPTNHLILCHPLLLPPSKKTRLAPLNGIGTFAEDQLPLNVKFISGFPSLFPSPPNGIFIVYFVPGTIQSTNSFTPQSNSVRWALFLPLLYRGSSWDNDFPKLVSGRPRTWT